MKYIIRIFAVAWLATVLIAAPQKAIAPAMLGALAAVLVAGYFRYAR